MAVSALSAVGLYGHDDLEPVVLWILFGQEAREAAPFWMLVVGLPVTSLFIWWSRRHRQGD